MNWQNIKNIIFKGWGSTKGYKTTAATAVWLTLRLIDLKFPGLINSELQAIILDGVTFLGTVGITDKIWTFIKEKLKKN